MSGKYVRTSEVRERNQRNARGYGQRCEPGCTCGKHHPKRWAHRRCEPDCQCGWHRRTVEHNMRISISRRAR